MKLLTNPLLFLGMGFLLCLLITTRSCDSKRESKGGGVSTVTKLDTIYIPKSDTIRLTVTKFVPKIIRVIKRDTIRVSVDSALAERTYVGTISKDSLKANYRITTTGTLDSLNLEFINNTPTTIIKETITKQSRGLYGGLGLDGAIRPSANLNYVDGRQIIGLDYKPTSSFQDPSNFTIRYSRKF